jgi:hypothetical protein
MNLQVVSKKRWFIGTERKTPPIITSSRGLAKRNPSADLVLGFDVYKSYSLVFTFSHTVTAIT